MSKIVMQQSFIGTKFIGNNGSLIIIGEDGIYVQGEEYNTQVDLTKPPHVDHDLIRKHSICIPYDSMDYITGYPYTQVKLGNIHVRLSDLILAYTMGKFGYGVVEGETIYFHAIYTNTIPNHTPVYDSSFDRIMTIIESRLMSQQKKVAFKITGDIVGKTFTSECDTIIKIEEEMLSVRGSQRTYLAKTEKINDIKSLLLVIGMDSGQVSKFFRLIWETFKFTEVRFKFKEKSDIEIDKEYIKRWVMDQMNDDILTLVRIGHGTEYTRPIENYYIDSDYEHPYSLEEIIDMIVENVELIYEEVIHE